MNDVTLPSERDRACDEDPQLTRLSILIRVGQVLASGLELEPLLEAVYREVGRLFDVGNFFVVVRRPGEPTFEFALHFEHGRRQERATQEVGLGITGYILRTGRALHFPRLQDKLGFLAQEGVVSHGERSRSWMGVPLVSGDQVVGVMVVQDYERENAYSPDDLELFSVIASQVAVAVRNAQLYEDLQRRAREMEAIVAVGRDLTSTLDMDGVLARIASSVREMLTHDSVAIFFEREDGESFRVVAFSGLVGASKESLELKRGRGILGSIIVAGRSEIIPDTSRDPRGIHIPGTKPREAGEKLMATPLLNQDRVIGVMAVWRRPEEPAFQPVELDFLEGIGRQASVAIRNAQLYGQAKASLAEAENANRAKSAFLASMSHELRTPLNAILLYCELLKEEVGSQGEAAGTADDLERIEKAGRHLLGLIDDILDLSKIEAGRMDVFLEECSVEALVADVAAMISPLVARNRNRFALEVDPGLGNLRTDYRKVRQTLCNLLSNAAKFTEEGTVTLRVGRVPGFVRFEVVDTGIGMSPEQVERAFAEFSQAEDSTFSRFGGTGLGLTLCRKFMNLLGGEVQVETHLGQGSTFRVRIPDASTEP